MMEEQARHCWLLVVTIEPAAAGVLSASMLYR
jgi:hypothetical protein